MKNYDDPEERDRAFQNKMKKKNDEMMAKYGWYAHYVPNDDDSPTGFNGHTHGFDITWKHPDIQIVVGMPGPQIHSLMIRVADLLKEGKRFEPGVVYDDVLQGEFPVMFAWASEGGRRVLRMILPDQQAKVRRDEIGEPYSIQWIGTEEAIHGD